MPICHVCSKEVDRYANNKRCRECYNEYMREYMKKRFHQKRAEMIAILGGVCVHCGTTEKLEFDHIFENTKSWDIGKIWGHRKVIAELKKIQLLCNSCHKKKSARYMSVDHGGGLSGKDGCKCTKCKARKAEYMKKYNKPR